MVEIPGLKVGRLPDVASESRAFWKYWTASTISNTGTAITSVALPLLAVRVLDASPLQVSLLAASTYAAWVVLGLPAGAIVEHFPMRLTQVVMDVVRALALLSIPLAWAFGRLNMTQLVAVALVISAATVIFDVGNATFLPTIVPQEQLDSRNSLTSASAAATQLGGPSLSGVIVMAFGWITAILTDAISYVCSAFLLYQLKGTKPRTSPTSQSVLSQIQQGWRAVIRHPQMKACMQAATAVNFVAGGLMAIAPVFLVRSLHTPVTWVGVLLAFEGVGSLAGAAITPKLAARFGSANSVVLGCLLAAVSTLLIAVTGSGVYVTLFAVGSAGFGAGVVVLSILARTHRQIAAERHLLAQVMATVRFVSWGAIPLGAVSAGVLSSAFSVRVALGGMSLAACGAPFLLIRNGFGQHRDLVVDLPASEPALSRPRGESEMSP